MAYSQGPTPRRDVGEVLTGFFLHLLADGRAMSAYQSGDDESRTALIDSDFMDFNEFDSGAVAEARRLLREGSLKDIELHVRAIESNPQGAMPTMIVWPPM